MPKPPGSPPRSTGVSAARSPMSTGTPIQTSTMRYGSSPLCASQIPLPFASTYIRTRLVYPNGVIAFSPLKLPPVHLRSSRLASPRGSWTRPSAVVIVAPSILLGNSYVDVNECIATKLAGWYRGTLTLMAADALAAAPSGFVT